MADASSNLNIIISAQDQASAVLEKINDKATGLGNNLKNSLKNSVVALGGAFAATSGIIYSSIGAYDENQRAIEQLNARLISTGGAAGMSKDSLVELSQELQRTTTISDETALAGENMLLSFTSIGKDIFPQASKAILDTAYAMNNGLTPSAEQLADMTKQLGKALQDPEAGLGALHRVGVNVDELKEKFKTVTDTAERQKLIIAELGTEFGGSALAATRTFGGQMEKLNNTLNDTQEILGKGLVDSLNKLTGGANGASGAVENLNKFLLAHNDVLEGVSIALIALAGAFGVLLVSALAVAAGASLAFVGTIGVVVATIGFATGFIISHWDDITTNIKNSVTIWGIIVKTVVNQIISDIKGMINSIVDSINGIINGANSVASKIHLPTLPTIPHLASGTDYFEGGMALVGENGPELVSLPTGSSVKNANDTSKLLSQSQNVTFNFTGNITLDSQDRINQLANQIAKVLGRQNELAAKGVSI